MTDTCEGKELTFLGYLCFLSSSTVMIRSNSPKMFLKIKKSMALIFTYWPVFKTLMVYFCNPFFHFIY